MPVLLLLFASNVFMTTAWYWHLKGGMQKPLLTVILIGLTVENLIFRNIEAATIQKWGMQS